MRKLLLDVIFQIAESGAISGVQRTQLALKNRLIQDLPHTDTPARSLITVARANTLASSTNLATTQLGLLQTIYNGVQLKADMSAVGNENALASTLETLLLKRSQLLEKAGNVNDGTSTDKVDT